MPYTAFASKHSKFPPASVHHASANTSGFVIRRSSVVVIVPMTNFDIRAKHSVAADAEHHAVYRDRRHPGLS